MHWKKRRSISPCALDSVLLFRGAQQSGGFGRCGFRQQGNQAAVCFWGVSDVQFTGTCVMCTCRTQKSVTLSSTESGVRSHGRTRLFLLGICRIFTFPERDVGCTSVQEDNVDAMRLASDPGCYSQLEAHRHPPPFPPGCSVGGVSGTLFMHDRTYNAHFLLKSRIATASGNIHTFCLCWIAVCLRFWYPSGTCNAQRAGRCYCMSWGFICACRVAPFSAVVVLLFSGLASGVYCTRVMAEEIRVP